jgi:hypothetical protein
VVGGFRSGRFLFDNFLIIQNHFGCCCYFALDLFFLFFLSPMALKNTAENKKKKG